MRWTREDEALLVEIEKYLERRNSLSVKTMNSAYYFVTQPLVENPISRSIENNVFHSVIGRTAIYSMTEFNGSVRSTLVYLFSLRLNALIEYLLDTNGLNTNGLITATIFCFTLLIIHSIITSVQQKMVMEKIGSNDIFEETMEDKVMKDRQIQLGFQRS